MSVVNVYGRSNSQRPEFSASGSQTNFNYTVTFNEGMANPFVTVVNTNAFLHDGDLDPIIERATITLANPLLSSSLEYLTANPGTLNYNNDNPYEIIISGTASLEVYRSVLSTLQYHNEAEEPLPTSRIIYFSIFDGLNYNYPLTTTTVIVHTVNDAPQLYPSGNTDDEFEIFRFFEGSDAEDTPVMAPNLTISDSDNSHLSSALIVLSTIFDEGNESISINTTLLTQYNVSCVPISCSGTSLQLNGNATVSNYQSLLRSLKYINYKKPADFPSLFDRIVNITVSDGELTSNPDAHVLVDIIPTNPRVIIDLDTPNHDYSIDYVEGSNTNVTITGKIRWVDISLDTLLRMVIRIRDPKLEAGEELVVDRPCIFGFNISSEYNTELKQVIFGLGTMQSFLDVIDNMHECVAYRNSEPEPLPVVRHIDFIFIPGGGAPNDTATTTITIIPINDNTPICPMSSQFTIPLSEGTLTGVPIHTVTATDADKGSNHGNISYRLITNWPDVFNLMEDEESASISLLQQVDFDEGIRNYPTIVEACDGGLLCCNFSFIFIVTDINDNPPQFINDPYTVYVEENEVKTILEFTHTDIDSGSNSQISDITINSVHPSGGCTNIFRVVQSPLRLETINGGMDYETQPICYVFVTITDGGSPSLHASTNVTVMAFDVDDRPPVLLEPKTFTVYENNTVPYMLGTLIATDPDSNVGSLVFSLVNVSSVFSLTASGVLSVLIVTDRSIAEIYTIDVQVTDPFNNSVIDQITINVLAINNDPPVLTLNNLPVVFTEESNTPVTLLSSPVISDLDDITLTINKITAVIANVEDPTLETLSIAAGAPSHAVSTTINDLFELIIMPTNQTDIAGIITLIKSIQYLNTQDEPSACRSDKYTCISPNSRTIRISVFDTLFYSNIEDAIVTFAFVNDAPEIDLDTTIASNRVIRYTEGDPPTQVVNGGNFFVKDDDNATLEHLSCTLLNTFDGSLEMLMILGNIPSSVTATGNNSHVITLTGMASTGDYTTALSLIYYYSISSDPTMSDGRIINCTASDGLVIGQPGLAEVSFQTLNNLPILTLGLSNVEFVEESDFIYIASNSAITDVDDTMLSSLSASFIGSNADELIVNVSLINLSDSYGCSGSVCSLSVTGLAPISDYVTVLNNILYRSTLTEFPSLSDIVIEFTVTDASGNTSAPANVTISFEAVDDNQPAFTNDTYTSSISESAAIGSLAIEVIVTDADLPVPQTPVFEIESGNEADKFMIANNPSSHLKGIITVKNLLDYDITTQYILTITASSVASAQVIITVINENNRPIVFDILNMFSVYESRMNNFIAESLMPPSVQALDPDNFPITYSVESSYVTINSTTGHLHLGSIVNREGIPGINFSMNITATDGVSSVTHSTIVNVLDVNEFMPVFDESKYELTIIENAPPTNVLNVSASDADEAPDISFTPGFVSRINYTLVSSAHSSYFSIDSDSGRLYLTTPLDYEVTGSYFVLEVVASDNDPSFPLSSSAVINISVINVNDETPFFTDFVYNIIVDESPRAPSSIQINGNDNDVDSNLTYTLHSTLGSIPFTISAETGLLFFPDNLDVDSLSSIHIYPLTVTLTDLNTDSSYTSSVSANFTITVRDINDNTPVFDETSYKINVIENMQVNIPGGIVISTISATDGDYGSYINGSSNGNKEITYSLANEPAGVFAIDSNSGQLKVLKSLDRETSMSYSFDVIAADNPDQDTSNFVTVPITVTVLDVNEHAPVADPSYYFSTILESALIDSVIETKVSIQWANSKAI